MYHYRNLSANYDTGKTTCYINLVTYIYVHLKVLTCNDRLHIIIITEELMKYGTRIFRNNKIMDDFDAMLQQLYTIHAEISRYYTLWSQVYQYR